MKTPHSQKLLSDAALAVLNCPDPVGKATLGRRTAKGWRDGKLLAQNRQVSPDRPQRPARPELLAPRDMPRRRGGGTVQNRIALLHSLAHIEFNAIDLAWDMVVRFGHDDMPRAFFDDWIGVADDEARHFMMLQDRLMELGSAYGDMPAHDGLWQAAEATKDDILARLAIVPLVLEARGLDVTPDTICRLERAEDFESVRILRIILDDEINHVAAGARWFNHFCAQKKLVPDVTFQGLVRQYFHGQIKPPFNKKARQEANFPEKFYLPLTFKAQKGQTI